MRACQGAPCAHHPSEGQRRESGERIERTLSCDHSASQLKLRCTPLGESTVIACFDVAREIHLRTVTGSMLFREDGCVGRPDTQGHATIRLFRTCAAQPLTDRISVRPSVASALRPEQQVGALRAAARSDVRTSQGDARYSRFGPRGAGPLDGPQLEDCSISCEDPIHTSTSSEKVEKTSENDPISGTSRRGVGCTRPALSVMHAHYAWINPSARGVGLRC